MISEMMQQTQIATGLRRGFHTRILETFPNVESLAAADAICRTRRRCWRCPPRFRRVILLDAMRA